MSRNATLGGDAPLCPPPLVAQSLYPKNGGDTNARFCVDLPGLGLPDCCLPCPKQNYFYRDEFQTLIHSTTYVNIAGVACCCFLLLSFAVLPVEATRRHYLSVCLTFAVLLMQVSFVIPLGGGEDQCFDEITPHDMYSSMNCALSGAFLLGGGWCVVMWAFLRTLSLHLQICWQVVPGRKYFLASQAAGWIIPVVFLAVALCLTGVSFRFGENCHINSKNGVQTFWGPMLAMAAASIVTQFITFGYVTQVYLRSLFEDKPSTAPSTTNSRSVTTSVRTVSAFQALRRIKRVLELQWRGIFVVVIILADVIFFSTVFLQFDGTTQKTPKNVEHGIEWLLCVLSKGGDKNQCLEEARQLVVEEGVAFSVLFLLSFNGIWALILLGRFSIYPAWAKLIKSFFSKKKGADEFVSYNARRVSETGASTYEMLESKQRHTASSGEFSILKPEPTLSPIAREVTQIREYNPQTFSAQLRSRSGSDGNPPYPVFRDLESGAPDRHPTTTPLYTSLDPALQRDGPYSPYQDSPIISPRSGGRIGMAK